MDVINLLGSGLVGYEEVDDLQRRLHADVLRGGPDRLVVSQMTPTITAGRHTRPEDLPDAPLPVIHVDRAGSATWHGPGQLVVYPVVRLREPVDLVAWIRSVEAGVISTVRDEWGLDAHRIEGRAGVWLTDEGRRDRKICAIGLKVARGATLHGLALNVDIDPDSAFSGIIPCGLTDADVACLSWEGVSTTVSAAADALLPRLVESILPQLASADDGLVNRSPQ
ncbi:lipoyl(octanoyl) transferase LipB [Actinomyces sp. B33]|uniref:lipoyl(octanoyl) transferase LipB n=1 Tax=Actinomyces sp. B33 TaxID=2942131 RepID=UPI0023420226|nr:lipoyl(octanoyl) transferase LipB [Actinomyces sp. B33]MDC4232990.1 lipoyl(octanoyl) transferase LipB [Actinomyces sp. B33]